MRDSSLKARWSILASLLMEKKRRLCRLYSCDLSRRKCISFLRWSKSTSFVLHIVTRDRERRLHWPNNINSIYFQSHLPSFFKCRNFNSQFLFSFFCLHQAGHYETASHSFGSETLERSPSALSNVSDPNEWLYRVFRPLQQISLTFDWPLWFATHIGQSDACFLVFVCATDSWWLVWQTKPTRGDSHLTVMNPLTI